MGHLLGGEKNIFLIRDIDGPTASKTADARSLGVARRAGRAARRGTASSVNKFHSYTRHETRP